MITLRKLASLKESTRHRKIAVILQALETNLIQGQSVDRVYLRDLLQFLYQQEEIPLDWLPFPPGEALHRKSETLVFDLNRLRHRILQKLGAQPADWDFTPQGPSEGVKRPFQVYLDGVRSPFNIGSIMRSLEAFGGERFYISPDTTSPDHPRAQRTAMGCQERLSWSSLPVEALEGPVFALELGGVPVDEFEFPPRGTVIVGSEELGISPEGRRRAEEGLGLVSIPLGGAKASLNVGVALGILLSWWCAKG